MSIIVLSDALQSRIESVRVNPDTGLVEIIGNRGSCFLHCGYHQNIKYGCKPSYFCEFVAAAVSKKKIISVHQKIPEI
jgi:hypothetical protein